MKTKKAVAGTTAGYDERHNRAYPSAKSMSTLKTILGGLLLFGNKKQKAFWPLLEGTLRQYVDLRVASQSVSDKPGATNSHRPD